MENVVRIQTEQLLDVGAQRRASVEDVNALRFTTGNTKLRGGAEHAVGCEPANLGRFDLEDFSVMAIDHPGSRERHRHSLSDNDVVGTTDDIDQIFFRFEV